MTWRFCREAEKERKRIVRKRAKEKRRWGETRVSKKEEIEKDRHHTYVTGEQGLSIDYSLFQINERRRAFVVGPVSSKYHCVLFMSFP